MRIDDVAQLDTLDFDKGKGLVPVVTQHSRTGEVLMLAYANREALGRSLETGDMWYFSRSRGRLWRKGEQSGHTHRVVSLEADCDRDTVLARVEPSGPSCHTGSWSCFTAPPVLAALGALLQQRANDPPAGSYTGRLLDDENLRLKKLGEETIEFALACAAGDTPRVVAEAADVFYHTLVACLGAGVSVDAVLEALEQRLPVGSSASAFRTASQSSTMRKKPGLRPYTPLQGQYLSFIHFYTKLNGRPPAETDMQFYFKATPPSVHDMVLRLEARGLIARVPGQARSIRLLLPVGELPELV